MRHILLAGLLATSAHAAPPGAVVEIDRSVARVGDAVIWESEVAARVKAGAERAAVLDMMIDEELVVDAGRKAGISVDRTEVLAAFEEIKKQNNLDDAGLDKALVDAGYTRARYLVELERQLIRLRAVNQILTPKVMIEDAAIEAEIKKRGLQVTDETKQTVKTELRRAALDKLTVEWVANLRKRAFITRRS